MRVIYALLLVLVYPVCSMADSWTSVSCGLSDSRWAPASALLRGGSSALVCGGYSYASDCCLSTADVFDERTNKFRPSRGHLTFPRDFASANVLPDGFVLITGGYNTVFGSLATAELYDPVADHFTLLSSRMSTGRELFTATTLHDGRVLMAGGLSLRQRHTVNTADLFDPVTQTFHALISPMVDDCFGQSAVCLEDGTVLIVGGKHWNVGHPDRPLATAEIFDPLTNTFSATHGSMAVARDRPTTSLLPDGDVLIAGGQNGSEGPRFAETYHPETETFSEILPGLQDPRMAHSAVTRRDGRVLLVGGWSPDLHRTLTTTEIYDPKSQVFSYSAPVPEGSHDCVLIAFDDGEILVAAGKRIANGVATSLSSAYISHE